MGSADLANLSDKLMLTTVVLYIVAMVAYAADLGFGRRRAATAGTEEGTGAESEAGAEAKEKAKVLVGAGGAAPADGAATATAGTADADTGDEAGDEAATGRRQVDWARLAITMNVLGWAAHLGTILTRGLAAERWPWGNMYEFLVAIAFAAVSAFLVVLWRFKARFLGAFVSLAAVVALGVANIWLYSSVGPLVRR